MEIKKLKGHSGMQCHVADMGHGILSFVSYSTEVLRAFPSTDKENVYLIEPRGQYWDHRVYTPTTAKQISYFLREYFPNLSYQEFKKGALNGYLLEVVK